MEFFKQANRITDKWTKTTAEAFGDTPAVRKGRAGELFIIETLRSWGWDVIDYEENREKQTKDIDIEFKDPKWARYYNASIKSNMDEYGNIFIYSEWIYKTHTDRIFHCNPETGWLCWYDTGAMQRYFSDNFQDYVIGKAGKPYLKISSVECRDFIKRRKHGGYNGA